MQQKLLSGNAALARAAFETGVTVAVGYPGTPSTEILENCVNYPDIYCEWSPNEKVAFEVGVGASLGGARTIVTMKHVGLNVAADPLLTFACMDVNAGFVVCVADDPGMHSSQNEQDTRHYARLAKIPILEPADASDMHEFLRQGLEISESFKTPVILRLTTRVSHSRAVVTLHERVTYSGKEFTKNPAGLCPVPAFARKMREKVEIRTKNLAAAAVKSELNRIESGLPELTGIIASGVSYNYVKEVFPDASVLKLGWSYPFPVELVRKFAASVSNLLIVEELDPIVEEQVKALGINCQGKDVVPSYGELSPDRLKETRLKLEGKEIVSIDVPSQAADLPPRPPVLCPGCPHRNVFTALKHCGDILVMGDIGCYSLGVSPPLAKIDAILCMGGGASMPHGVEKSGEKRKAVGILGDSTFFHSGMTGLLNNSYNKGTSTIIVLDNRTTAMTGHQENPGTGKTLSGEVTNVVSIAAIGKALGIPRVVTVNPYDLESTKLAFKAEIDASEPSLIVAEAVCPLRSRKNVGLKKQVDQAKCKKCKACLKVGCPAITQEDSGAIEVSKTLCIGCALCQQVCPFNAISDRNQE